MRKLFIAVAAILLTAIGFWSCQKELSVETGATPSAPAGGALTTYSWELTGNATKYSGCIDTAYYDNYNGSTFLRVEGTDNLGNFFYILVSASTGKATKGTFSAAQAQAMMVMVVGSKNYTINPAAIDFKVEITNISDTAVEASFSGKLVDQTTNTNFEITAGKLKARIAGVNPCSGGSTGGGGGTTPAAVYTLTPGTNNACGNASVAGTYASNTVVTSAEKATLSVNVTTAGTYSISTSQVNGLSFSGSGTFTATGVQNVVLQASGSPVAAGTTVIPVTAGTSSCSFNVTVAQGPAPAPYAFSFKDSTNNLSFLGPDTAIQFTQSGIKYLAIVGATVATFDSTMEIDIALPSGTIQTGTYVASNTDPSKGVYFALVDTSNNYLYETDPTLTGTTVTVVIAVHNTATKTVEGTFTATAMRNNVLVKITDGKFKARYQ